MYFFSELLRLGAQSSCLVKYFEGFDGIFHGLRTPNEGINQTSLKNWADVADKICFHCTVPKKLVLGLNFWPCSESYILSGRP